MKNPFGFLRGSSARGGGDGREPPTASAKLDDAARAQRTVRAYHRATRHDYQRFADGPGYLDWDSQPDPFRRYAGAELVLLPHPIAEGASYAEVMGAGLLPATATSVQAIGDLLRDSLALSAWKRLGEARWALRVNPSSGNLHPTEAYVLAGPVEGLFKVPTVAHYAPREHALELRGEISAEVWNALTVSLPPGTFFVGLSSIHWREAWKYGERAYRYCQHDVGHALAAIAFAARAQGWRVEVCDGLASEDLERLLGLDARGDAEPEEADVLLAILPNQASLARVDEHGGADCALAGEPSRRAESVADHALPCSLPASWKPVAWHGSANQLSAEHVEWSALEAAAAACRKPRTSLDEVRVAAACGEPRFSHQESVSFRSIAHARRSAVSFDGRTSIARDAFLRLLHSTVREPTHVLPYLPRVHLGLFVHRVDGLEPGLYLLVRDPSARELLQAAMHKPFDWELVPDAPADLHLYCLARGDRRAEARSISCHQEIASDGAFAVTMLAEFEPALDLHGAWFYARLHWECGAIGQTLYLEAEAIGVRATGIGCFFDEPAAAVFGLASERFRSLYHFTVGGPVHDPRLQSEAPYGDARARPIDT